MFAYAANTLSPLTHDRWNKQRSNQGRNFQFPPLTGRALCKELCNNAFLEDVFEKGTVVASETVNKRRPDGY